MRSTRTKRVAGNRPKRRCSSTRNAGGVRSDELFAILEALRDAGLSLSPPATTSVAQAPRDAAQEAPPLSERV